MTLQSVTGSSHLATFLSFFWRKWKRRGQFGIIGVRHPEEEPNGGLCVVLVPMKRPEDFAFSVSGAGRLFIESIRDLALEICGCNAIVCAFSSKTRLFHEFTPQGRMLLPKVITHRIRDLPHLAGSRTGKSFSGRFGGIAFCNPSFLIGEAPNYCGLIRAAQQRGLSVSGLRSSKDVYAAALTPEALENRPDFLVSLLKLITLTMDDSPTDGLTDLHSVGFVTPASALDENSPAVAGVAGLVGPHSYDAPIYVNTAIEEILSHSSDSADIGRDPLRMRTVFATLRDKSRVPWIFNELLNEIEYRIGSITPLSSPPEIHLALSGACNISCRFCSYTHGIASSYFITPDRIRKLGVLRQTKILRLSSGLGEPTLNHHLPEIVRFLARYLPHIDINFFTNGVLLNQPGLLGTLVNSSVRWINVSLNNASRETWASMTGSDHFDTICANLKAILKTKRAQGSIHPLMYGSMVLTRRNLDELPMMPELCRELGIDRFSAFPFSSFGYGGENKFGAEEAYHHRLDRYEKLYWKTVEAGKTYRVSLELPSPPEWKAVEFGTELRPLYDFAKTEKNEWVLGKLLCRLQFRESPGAFCFFLWRQAGIGSSNKTLGNVPETHYLYPCLGPLAGLNYTRLAPVCFSWAEEFMTRWNNPLFTLLRIAQHESHVCKVCDLCRCKDTRDPDLFTEIGAATELFAENYGLHSLDPARHGSR